ncbi:MAG: NUDIX hydrolase [Chloroflexi bacterium]|nr:MAG: NUDIX hydrolase [Chloroflexota bacterium]MBL1194719.1 NUDIX hydrolase [Chloroflexota bacterium]NOH12012.1 NUDIX hydrolase [Chloroflexota bacterium]
MDFKLLDSRDMFESRVFKLRRDHIRFPTGREAYFDLLQHNGAVAILPVDDEGRIWFVRQYRPAVGGMILEIPAGTLEVGEEPEACAAREIREEIGMAADKLEFLGNFYLAPGYSTEYMHLYLAKDLRPDPLEQDIDEYIKVEQYPVAEVYAMLHRNDFDDAKTVAALGLARSHFVDHLEG